jgi:hypothetical protein
LARRNVIVGHVEPVIKNLPFKVNLHCSSFYGRVVRGDFNNMNIEQLCIA